VISRLARLVMKRRGADLGRLIRCHRDYISIMYHVYVLFVSYLWDALRGWRATTQVSKWLVSGPSA